MELGIAQNSSAIANAVVAVVHFRATISTRYVACADMRLKKTNSKKLAFCRVPKVEESIGENRLLT